MCVVPALSCVSDFAYVLEVLHPFRRCLEGNIEDENWQDVAIFHCCSAWMVTYCLFVLASGLMVCPRILHIVIQTSPTPLPPPLFICSFHQQGCSFLVRSCIFKYYLCSFTMWDVVAPPPTSEWMTLPNCGIFIGSSPHYSVEVTALQFFHLQFHLQ